MDITNKRTRDAVKLALESDPELKAELKKHLPKLNEIIQKHEKMKPLPPLDKMRLLHRTETK